MGRKRRMSLELALMQWWWFAYNTGLWERHHREKRG